jgi:predicted GNAT family N-acyltransferase
MRQMQPFIQQIELEKIIDLRWKILRAGQPRESAIFDGDREPTTHHFAAIDENRVIACATILQRPWRNHPAWQLRGMAVDPTFRRSGLGAALLAEIDRFVVTNSHSRQLWCNARTSAVAFYTKFAWQTAGKEFVIPTAGPHMKMFKTTMS